MIKLITDRSEEHLELLHRLRKKGWSNMSASEREIWYGEAAKGAYNHTDLNRVESAVAEISGIWGLGPTTKTDWTVWDVPTKADMERYLSNVVAILDHGCSINFGLIFYGLLMPSTMDELTLEGANNIENALKAVYKLIYPDADEPDKPAVNDSRLGTFILGKDRLGGV